MKLVGAISTAVLSLTLGVGVPAYAQQEQQNQEEHKDKPDQEKAKEKKIQPEKPAKQGDKNARQEEKNTKPAERNAQQGKNTEEEKNAQQHIQEAKPGKQDEYARGSGGPGRIPEDRFRAQFGQEHRFRVNEGDYRNRSFQYGGYRFEFVGAWPSNWLYTQDVFVVEIDGVYYLCNATYPGVNIALGVTL